MFKLAPGVTVRQSTESVWSDCVKELTYHRPSPFQWKQVATWDDARLDAEIVCLCNRIKEENDSHFHACDMCGELIHETELTTVELECYHNGDCVCSPCEESILMDAADEALFDEWDLYIDEADRF